ncbi:MAG: thioredoxin family protein [Armatimonadota bacterium]|nr:thioredoxin family protein [Armatimonadota bacterium]MDR7440339.1 thioredoxin family protein [Armatimonadota bacterium]MDR7562295.1 thioredoxin family protein [Armatimonadota bacterium]MDR7568764.1 thioredoxin family protein [Armatimonadota bacterium]MDR7602530.1 thioredoxin family protein [Armatimonadota bacterium]
MANLRIGDRILPFRLPGTDGREHAVEDYADKAVLVVIFSCNHCPYVRAWEDRMIGLQRAYADRGVQFLLISSNDPEQYPEDSFDRMRERARQKGYPFPYLYDETQEVAWAYGAERTPEVFVFDRERVLRYHGAIDDNYEDPEAVRHPYLRDALEAVLAGQEVPVPETRPVGCTIKWRKKPARA